MNSVQLTPAVWFDPGVESAMVPLLVIFFNSSALGSGGASNSS
jgi:hypothetical protein